MKNTIKLGRITVDRQDSAETVQLYVKYTWNGEEKTDNGRLFVANNSYYPSIDQDDNQEEYDALQEAVENR